MYREWTYGILYRLDDRDMYILAQVNDPGLEFTGSQSTVHLPTIWPSKYRDVSISHVTCTY